MNSIAKLVLVLGTLGISTAFAAVTVTFSNSDSYADMPFTSSGKDETLKGIKSHFEKLGSQLPAGQDLKVDVLDIDLAGSLRPNSRTSADFRVLTGGADWPMMRIRYSIESQGKVIKSDEAKLSDMDYLRHMNHYTSGEPLRYEKQMLDDWFRKTLKSGS